MLSKIETRRWGTPQGLKHTLFMWKSRSDPQHCIAAQHLIVPKTLWAMTLSTTPGVNPHKHVKIKYASGSISSCNYQMKCSKVYYSSLRTELQIWTEQYLKHLATLIDSHWFVVFYSQPPTYLVKKSSSRYRNKHHKDSQHLLMKTPVLKGISRG